MEPESIVYGSIRGWPSANADECQQRRAVNRRALDRLPQGDGWPFIGREMFSCCAAEGVYQTQVIHFGASYRAVEYEWALWVRNFEALLDELYWTSAVVHLETELTGIHTFRWETESGSHSPHQRDLRMRCAWERDGGVLG